MEVKMPDDQAVQVERIEGFGSFLEIMRANFERLKPYLPSVLVECPSASPEPIDLYLGAWNGANFAETLLKSVNPGETFSAKLESIQEFSGMKLGQSLMIRVKKNVGVYNLKNLESYFGYALTVTPPVYPWWQPPATAVRWGPSHPYLVQSSATIYSYIIPDWEDVFYYFAIG
jgi:hypothetical protein